MEARLSPTATPLNPRLALAVLRDALPKGRTLPADEWKRRHRWMIWLLWGHSIFLIFFGLFHHASVPHAVAEGGAIAVFALLAQFLPVGQRAGATISALGLLSASAVLVHLSGGFIEAHFHYFVVMVLLTLYEAWWPYLIAVAFVLLQHGTIGVIDPRSVYNHASAIDHPWEFAAIHAAFIAAAGGAAILAWRLNETVRLELARQRKMEEDASLARIQAERANQAKSEFLSRVSHELRTPLTIILGFTEILENTNLANHQQGYVEKIHNAGAHLHDLIKDVLDIGRIEEGQLSLSLEALDANEVIVDVASLTQEMAALRHVEMKFDQTERCLVRADGQRLKQVLLNLVTNAIKYNVEGGRVTISLRPEGAEWCRISIADTGHGIKPADVTRLFIPFERLDAARQGVEGTGLGLALCKSLVDAMGGRIGVESKPGSGSTFWVELQRAAEEEANAPEGTSSPRARRVAYPASRTVLYVEDTVSNISLVGSILEQRPSIKLVPVMLGGLATQLARAHNPDLILLDLHLQDIDGEEVMARLAADPATRAVPVIVISADANPERIQKVLAAGARNYLTKPIRFERFLEVMDTYLHRDSSEVVRAK